MTEKILWKGEIEFNGTLEEFNQLSELMNKNSVGVIGADWWNKHHWAGLWPEPLSDVIGMERLTELMGQAVPTRLQYMRGIRGGIHTPHIHIGDQVALLGREQFKAVLSEAAAALAAKRVDVGLDYETAVTPVANLAINK